MAIVSFSKPCSEHIAHAMQVEAECFGEATMSAAAVIVEMAEIHGMADVLREWTNHTGDDSFTMNFFTDEGDEISIFYTV